MTTEEIRAAIELADEGEHEEPDEIPDCICYDSNLPARKDCPYCYPN